MYIHTYYTYCKSKTKKRHTRHSHTHESTSAIHIEMVFHADNYGIQKQKQKNETIISNAESFDILVWRDANRTVY